MKDRKELTELIVSNKFIKLAEVGVFRGATTKYVLEKSKRIKEYYAIDAWCAPKEYKDLGYDDVYFKEQYKKVLLLKRIYKSLVIIKNTSEEASKLIKDNYLDFVFLDADHKYESVKQDISLWLPKIKSGGVISGHDYGLTSFGFNVEKAVNELFNKEDIILLGRSCWWVRVK